MENTNKIKIKCSDWTEREFGLNSSNEWLLEKLPTQRWNRETQKSEDIFFLPILTVYELLNGLFPWRSYEEEFLNLGNTYNVQKTKRENKKAVGTIEDKVETKQMKGTLVINGVRHTGIRESVASSNIVTSDDALSWLDSKLSARVLKSICKRLGKVFRVGYDEADIQDKADLNESLTTTTQVVWWKQPKGETDFPEITAMYKDAVAKLDINKIDRAAVLVILQDIKKKMGIKTGSEEHTFIKKILEWFEKSLADNKAVAPKKTK